jgi:mono/diheme cytochrome c family protein
LLVLGAAGALVHYLATMPVTVPTSALPAHTPDLANGKYMFTAGGCAECHAVPLEGCGDLKIKDAEVLAGGRCLKTPFGMFNVPNISPDKETGIGNWTTLDFVNAMKRGIAPDGTYLYPAFPYPSYQRMTFEDLIDLKAYLDSLPAVNNKVKPSELRFPYNIRRALGLWDLLYVDGKSFTPDPKRHQDQSRRLSIRGRPLFSATPRAISWAASSRTPNSQARRVSRQGRVPNITPSEDGIGDWSEEDIGYLLETGTRPTMIRSARQKRCRVMAKLTLEDREAIAAYQVAATPADAVPRPKNRRG